MREALFTVSQRPDGTLIGENAALGLAVCAMERETLQEEARDALIHALGPAHVSYRVRLQPSPRNRGAERSNQCSSAAALRSGIRH
jgi:hypothetical protein